jgi:hypothetical protein
MLNDSFKEIIVVHWTTICVSCFSSKVFVLGFLIATFFNQLAFY